MSTMENLGSSMKFRFTILGDDEKRRNISYIRKTRPDYLLEITGLKIKHCSEDDDDMEECVEFPDTLDYFFYLNYGDLFTCIINVFEAPTVLYDHIALLLSEVGRKREECNMEIERCRNASAPKRLNSSHLAQLNTEYKELARALAFCSALSFALYEDAKKDGLFRAAASVLLTTSDFDYGAVSPKILQKNLKEANLFREIETKICFYGDGSEEYSFRDLFSLIGFEVRKLINRQCEVKICENCGRLFIPATRSDEKYCDFPFQGNKTCKNVAFAKRLDRDNVLKTYRKIYKTQNARKQRNGHKLNISEHFQWWSKYAKARLRQCQNGEITLDQMINDISGDAWMDGDTGNS